MKKLFAILAVFFVLICYLSSCGKSDYAREQESKREAIYQRGYEDGYDEGYYVGYYDGAIDAQRGIFNQVEDDLWSIASDIEDKYGLHPEDAVMVLSNYADVPDEVTEEELHQAIWAIYRYYHQSQDVINGIEDYCIE